MPDDIISLTEFKNDASGWIERLQHRAPVVLTQNGRGKAVVQSYESYQQQRFALALLKRAIRGEADAAAGRLVPHAQVMSEVNAQIDAIEARKKEARHAPAAKVSTKVVRMRRG